MEKLMPGVLIGAALLFFLIVIGIRRGIRSGWFQSSSRIDIWSFLGKAATWLKPLLKKGIWIVVVLWFLCFVITSMSSCTQNVYKDLASIARSSDETKERDIPISDDSTTKDPSPSLSKVDVLKWLRTVETMPGENGWERVLMEGTHRSPGKYGCEFITNCSLLGDCMINLAPLDGHSKLSKHGRSMFNSGSVLVNHENRSIGKIIEYSSGTQSIDVQEAQLLYLLRRTCDDDHYLNTPLGFKWRLVEKHPREVVRMAFKRDLSSLKLGKEVEVDFTILPFQLPDPCDGLPVRTQFDLSITLTRPLSDEPKPTVDTPKPSHELLEAFPSVIKMIATDNDDGTKCEIFSHEVAGNNWRISSEEIRERWLNPDVHKLGKIVIVLRQPLIVHVAYCVRGERW